MSDEDRVAAIEGNTDGWRLVLDLLAEEGQASARKLAEQLPVSRQAVIKHLNTLANVGPVRSGRAGREVLYQVQPAPLDESAR